MELNAANNEIQLKRGSPSNVTFDALNINLLARASDRVETHDFTDRMLKATHR